MQEEKVMSKKKNQMILEKDRPFGIQQRYSMRWGTDKKTKGKKVNTVLFYIKAAHSVASNVQSTFWILQTALPFYLR